MIFVSLIFLASYLFTGTFELYRLIELAVKTGSLYIGGLYPRVERIYMNQTPTNIIECTYTPTVCSMSGTQGTTRATGIRATIVDENGDCDSATVNYYVCQGLVATCAGNAAYTGALGSPVKYTVGTCTNCYCNFTGTFNLQYWRRWKNWTINVTVTDPTNRFNQTNRTWYYSQLVSLAYPWTSTGIGTAIPLGEVYMGQWNYGGDVTQGNVTRNWGNIRLNVTYNATDFTFGTNTIDVHANTFAVSNRSGNPFGYPGQYRNMSSSPSIPVEFFPTGGMRRCGNNACSADEDGAPNWANYTLWWEIYVPMGLVGGTYTNSIEVSAYAYTAAG
ncbi:MAG: hypothetical protein QMD36_05055 [Candidatus Aenigmarchaeota archaeon]|nr:hypothetical protein [Candidatus Aenigmarchaeota archaeon]